MTRTLETASSDVRTKINRWCSLWGERCELIKNFREHTYSRHILLLLPDLIEEIESNSVRLDKNEYGKRFFAHHLMGYVSLGASSKTSANMLVEQSWAQKIRIELRLVLEALGEGSHAHRLGLSSLVPLLRGIDSRLQTPESFDFALNLLKQTLLDGNSPWSEGDAIFLTDTLALLFWRRGFAIESVDKYASRVTETFDGVKAGDKFFPTLPGAPGQGKSSAEEYGRLLESFYRSLSLDDRFGYFQRKFESSPEQYEVIFRLTGVDLRSPRVEVGNVTIYDPRLEKHIKEEVWQSGIENAKEGGHCVSFILDGMDGTPIVSKARRDVERALALLPMDRERHSQLRVSDQYVVCDSKGRLVQATTARWMDTVHLNEDWKRITEPMYTRLGHWLKARDTHPSVRRLLVAFEWHRRSEEALDGSAELLDAWFSIEQLFDQSHRLSKRVPSFLRCRPGSTKGTDLWLTKPVKIGLVQFTIALNQIRQELRAFAGKTAGNFLNPIAKNSHGYRVPEGILQTFVNQEDSSWSPQDFVENCDLVIEALRQNGTSSALDDVSNVKQIFYDRQYATDKIQQQFWRVKDDIYNIYRLRNMLVHAAETNSRLLDYYANRAREYGFFLLQTLKWKMLRTKSETEIQSLGEYLREMTLEASVALESLQMADTQRFRDWIFPG